MDVEQRIRKLETLVTIRTTTTMTSWRKTRSMVALLPFKHLLLLSAAEARRLARHNLYSSDRQYRSYGGAVAKECSLLLYGRPCPSWNATSNKFDFKFSHVITKSLSMFSGDNSTINFFQCRIFKRHPPSLRVTPWPSSLRHWNGTVWLFKTNKY